MKIIDKYILGRFLKILCFALISFIFVVIIVDLIDPVHPASKRLAADEYDAVAMEQSQKIDGNLNAFKFFKMKVGISSTTLTQRTLINHPRFGIK